MYSTSFYELWYILCGSKNSIILMYLAQKSEINKWLPCKFATCISATMLICNCYSAICKLAIGKSATVIKFAKVVKTWKMTWKS